MWSSAGSVITGGDQSMQRLDPGQGLTVSHTMTSSIQGARRLLPPVRVEPALVDLPINAEIRLSTGLRSRSKLRDLLRRSYPRNVPRLAPPRQVLYSRAVQQRQPPAAPRPTTSTAADIPRCSAVPPRAEFASSRSRSAQSQSMLDVGDRPLFGAMCVRLGRRITPESATSTLASR
jgi:hypothetical protein